MELNPSLIGDIFINYYLQKEKYNEFKKRRTYAKSISLKYVWHRSGHFFTKKGDGEKAYVFSTTKDLDSILLKSEKVNKVKLTRM